MVGAVSVPTVSSHENLRHAVRPTYQGQAAWVERSESRVCFRPEVRRRNARCVLAAEYDSADTRPQP
jgi:hypothetical protein